MGVYAAMSAPFVLMKLSVKVQKILDIFHTYLVFILINYIFKSKV